MTLDQFQPGVPVFVYTDKAGTKLRGIAGQGWQKDGPIPMVKFENDQVVLVTEESCKFFHLEILN